VANKIPIRMNSGNQRFTPSPYPLEAGTNSSALTQKLASQTSILKTPS
jgi:hypothetical protein